MGLVFLDNRFLLIKNVDGYKKIVFKWSSYGKLMLI